MKCTLYYLIKIKVKVWFVFIIRGYTLSVVAVVKISLILHYETLSRATKYLFICYAYIYSNQNMILSAFLY